MKPNLTRLLFVSAFLLGIVVFSSMSNGVMAGSHDDSGSHDSDSRSHDDSSSDDNCCEGKVTELTLQYNGAANALVEVVQKKDDNTLFTNTVDPGEQFVLIGADKHGTLSSEISILVNGELNTKIHTSCSKPIGPGLVSGDFEVISGYSRNGGLLCEIEAECATLNVEGDIAVNCEVVINSDGEWVGAGGPGSAVETDPTVPESVKDGTDWGEIAGIPLDIADGDDVDDNDADPSNEIQQLTFANGILSLGGSTVSPDLNSLGDTAWVDVTGKPTDFHDLGGVDAVDDNDADPSNEIQQLTFANGILSLGGSTVSPDLNSLGDTAWADVTDIPADIADGDDGITVELDPIFGLSEAANILVTDTTNWNTAYGWGDHSLLGYFSNSGEAGTADRTLGNTDNFGLGFLTNGSNRLHIQNDGNVGIGTTSPGSKLEVNGDVQANNAYRLFDTNGAINTQNWTLRAAPSGFGVDGNFEIFEEGLGSRLVIADSTGNVGIGSATPTAKLEVIGQIRMFDGTQGDGRVLTSNASGYATWQDPGSLWTESGSNVYYNTGNVNIGSATSPNPAIKLYVHGKATVFGASTGNPNNYLTDFGGARNYIRGETVFDWGNIGIGTATPQAKLEVVGQIKMNHASKGAGKVLTSDADGLAEWKDAFSGLWGGTAGSDIYYNTGNVGIGTTNPGARLDVQAGSAGGLTSFLVNGEDVNTGLVARFRRPSAAEADLTIFTVGNADAVIASEKNLRFDTAQSGQTVGTPRMMILNGGNVGIGTTSPGAKMSLSTPNNTNADLLSFDEGTSKIFTFQGQFSGSLAWNTYLNLHDYYGNDVMTWRNGRVGIGEIYPQTDLHIHNDVDSLTGIRIQNDNTGANANMRISFANAQGTQAGINLFGSGASAPYTNSMNIFNNRTGGGIRLSTEGTERAHLDNSGKLGIGKHTPGRRLHVKAFNDTDMNIRLEEGGTGTEFFDIGIDNSGDLNIVNDNNETALSILNSNGNVGIRTSSPVTSLQINSTADASLSSHGAMVLGATNSTNIVMDNNEIIARNNGLVSTLYVNKDGGNVILGKNSSKIGIGTTSIYSTRAINTWTGAYLTTGGTWTNSSSRELKENIIELTYDNAFTTLMNLTPVTYNYKVDKEEAYAGFIAEDVPELVATNDRKGLAPMDIVAVLTKVTQKQQEQIDQLKCKLAAYETRQTAIEVMLLALSIDLPKEKLVNFKRSMSVDVQKSVH